MPMPSAVTSALRLFPRTACAAVLAATVLCAVPTTAVHAAPPAQHKTQAPGYYRMMLGQLEVTALYDGYIDLPTKVLKYSSAREIQSLLGRMFLVSTPGVQTSVNAYLVHTGSQLILVDAGTGNCFGPTLGRVAENLRAAGYAPEQVDVVLLTHLHGDHACGLTANGQAVYPNANVYVDEAEAAFWLDEGRAAAAPKDDQGNFAMARDGVAPYRAAGRFHTFRSGTSPIPGVQAMAEHGHTPGHSGYLFTSGHESLLLWGDVVHSHAVQFRRPRVAMEFDTDPRAAIATRQRIFADAARDKLWVGGAHLPFPGIGHVRRDVDGYAWVPVEYGPVRADR